MNFKKIYEELSQIFDSVEYQVNSPEAIGRKPKITFVITHNRFMYGLYVYFQDFNSEEEIVEFVKQKFDACRKNTCD